MVEWITQYEKQYEQFEALLTEHGAGLDRLISIYEARFPKQPEAQESSYSERRKHKLFREHVLSALWCALPTAPEDLDSRCAWLFRVANNAASTHTEIDLRIVGWLDRLLFA